MLKKIAATISSIVLLAAPALASAQTLSDITAQLQDAIVRLQSLQSHTGTVLGASTTDDTPTGKASAYYCPQLTQTLKRGSRDATTGGQVTELQTFLTDYFDFDESIAVSGFFGKTTQKYVVQFQQENNLPAFGIVGSLTRTKIAEVCGNGGGGSTNPPVLFSASPTSGHAPLVVNLSADLRKIKTGPTAGDIKIEFFGENDVTVCKPSVSGVSACPPVWSGKHTYTTAGSQKAILIQCPDNNANSCEIGFTILGTIEVSVNNSTSCTLDGVTVANGASRTFYSDAAIAYGNVCSTYAQSRTCTNGTLSGTDTYKYSVCVVGDPNACSFNGQTVNHGAAVTAYQSSQVAYGLLCSSVAQTRTCSNGTLSGTYQYASCSVAGAASCTFNGQNVNNGSSVTAYQTPTVPNGQFCSSVAQARTCTNGALSGSYQYPTCSVAVTVPNVIVGYWSVANQLTAGDYIQQTYAESNVAMIPPDENGLYLPRIAKATSLGLKSMLMVESKMFDGVKLLPNYAANFDALWSVVGDQQSNIVGFYLLDEPYGNNQAAGTQAIAESTLKAGLDAAATYIHQKAPGRPVALTETPANVNRSDLANLFPDSIDYFGVNCYFVTGQEWCSDARISSFIAKLVSVMKPHQKLIVTSDGVAIYSPTPEIDSSIRSRIVYWENLLAPYFAANKVGAFTPFIYQNFGGSNYGLNALPNSLTEMKRYMGTVKNGNPTPYILINLARNSTITASAQYLDNAPSLAIDGVTTTGWNSGGGAPQWIKLDFGGPRQIERLRLLVGQSPAGHTTHSVYVSATGSDSDWHLFTTFYGDTANGEVLDMSPAQPLPGVRYVKIITTETPSWAAWREIEIYGQ